MSDELDPQWIALMEAGKLSGHVVCRCPECGLLQMASYRPQSQPWPVCINHPGTLSSTSLRAFPRVVPVSDPAEVVNKTPGDPRTPTQALADGDIYAHGPRVKVRLRALPAQAPQGFPGPSAWDNHVGGVIGLLLDLDQEWRRRPIEQSGAYHPALNDPADDTGPP
jgi:hypothetical protein